MDKFFYHEYVGKCKEYSNIQFSDAVNEIWNMSVRNPHTMRFVEDFIGIADDKDKLFQVWEVFRLIDDDFIYHPFDIVRLSKIVSNLCWEIDDDGWLAYYKLEYGIPIGDRVVPQVNRLVIGSDFVRKTKYGDIDPTEEFWRRLFRENDLFGFKLLDGIVDFKCQRRYVGWKELSAITDAIALQDNWFPNHLVNDGALIFKEDKLDEALGIK